MANSLIGDNGRLNIDNYNEKVRKQRETFSQIDSTMAILEKLPDFVDTTLDYLNANSFTFAVSPMGFLFNILHELGVSEETIRKWITDILVYVLPTVEIGVKAALLSNIKSLISCNSDPRIPIWLRKKVSNNVYTNILTGINENRGIDISVDSIDPSKILDLSPFTQPGEFYYFGNYGNENENRIAKLVRADDFNAFLWYVVHKGNKQNPIFINIAGGMFEFNKKIYTILNKDSDSILGVTNFMCNGESDIIQGTTVVDENNPTIISMCIDVTKNNEDIITGGTLVNISSDWFSCNWYTDKSNYYSSNLGIKESNRKRDYSKEKGICNLRCYKEEDYLGEEIPGAPNNIRFTILPKPYVLLPSVHKTEGSKLHAQWRPIRLMFDADGNPNQLGKFSLISETYDLQPTLVLDNDKSNDEYAYYDVYGIRENGVHEKGATLVVNNKNGRYQLIEITNLTSILVECYPGLTVYEFNYDYIMGMKLFDPKVVCQRIFDSAANPKYTAAFSLSLNKTKDSNKYPFLSEKQKIIEIVKNILEEDDDEINDCFYTFSNEKYDELLKKTEEIRYRQLPYNQGYNDGTSIDFSEAYATLENFPENGSLEEQKTIINKALEQACNAINERNNLTVVSDKSTTNIDFMTNILQQLVAVIVDALLSPKVLMLLMVNKTLIDPEDKGMYDSESLMRAFKNVIKSAVKEVRDLIMKKILDYIIEYLTPLALQIQLRVESEQFASYMAIIRLLTSYVNNGIATASRLSSILNSSLGRFINRDNDGNNTEIDLPSIIDDVNYADIYPSDSNQNNEPIIKNC